MKPIALLILLLGLTIQSIPLQAAEPDPFHGRLLPLELVMEFRRDIEMSRSQSDAVGELVVELQKSVAEKQWVMQSAYFDLIEELDEETVAEARAIELLDTALVTENQIKLEQIRFLIRLRNLLQPEQIRYLRERIDAGWTEE
ncbi:MAG: hypothetical protein AAF513_19100 [Pseudomonadota bacterium]